MCDARAPARRREALRALPECNASTRRSAKRSKRSLDDRLVYARSAGQRSQATRNSAGKGNFNSSFATTKRDHSHPTILVVIVS